MKKHLLIPVFWLVFYSAYLYSSPFYVSPTGNDNNVGTRENPFASIQGALSKISELRGSKELKGNVELIIQKGEYRIIKPITFSSDLWDGEDTLFIRGEGDDKPVIKGSVNIGKFREVSGNLWKIDLAELSPFGGQDVQQLFVNGKRAVRARTPNFGNMFKTGKVHEIKLDSNNSVTGGMALQKMFLTENQFNALKPAFSEIPQVIVSIHHAWDRTREFIQNVSVKDSSVFIFNHPMPPWNKLDNSSQFYFENSSYFLDSPGE